MAGRCIGLEFCVEVGLELQHDSFLLIVALVYFFDVELFPVAFSPSFDGFEDGQVEQFAYLLVNRVDYGAAD
jgi:hypothetical protein